MDKYNTFSTVLLALINVLFDLQNGIYTLKSDPSSDIVEIIINILTFGLGIIGMVWAWNAFRRMTGFGCG